MIKLIKSILSIKINLIIIIIIILLPIAIAHPEPTFKNPINSCKLSNSSYLANLLEEIQKDEILPYLNTLELIKLSKTCKILHHNSQSILLKHKFQHYYIITFGKLAWNNDFKDFKDPNLYEKLAKIISFKPTIFNNNGRFKNWNWLSNITTKSINERQIINENGYQELFKGFFDNFRGPLQLNLKVIPLINSRFSNNPQQVSLESFRKVYQYIHENVFDGNCAKSTTELIPFDCWKKLLNETIKIELDQVAQNFSSEEFDGKETQLTFLILQYILVWKEYYLDFKKSCIEIELNIAFFAIIKFIIFHENLNLQLLKSSLLINPITIENQLQSDIHNLFDLL